MCERGVSPASISRQLRRRHERMLRFKRDFHSRTPAQGAEGFIRTGLACCWAAPKYLERQVDTKELLYRQSRRLSMSSRPTPVCGGTRQQQSTLHAKPTYLHPNIFCWDAQSRHKPAVSKGGFRAARSGFIS